MFKDDIRKEFENHVIPYWKSLIDKENGGFYGKMKFDLTIEKEADKGCILNSRILWFFSNAYKVLKDEDSLKYAEHAYHFLKDSFLDKENGGLYWSVTYDGKPKETLKHTYNMAFAIYGLSSYYEISGDEEAVALAKQLFSVIEEKCRDNDGYLEAFSVDFGQAPNDKLSENGVMADRTMNTLLHVMEAYTELYRVSPFEKVREKLVEILAIFRTKMFNPDKERLEVFFDKNYASLIDLHSYGHDIEAAWLIDRTLEVLGIPTFTEEMAPVTKILTEKIYNVAFDGHSVPAECEDGNVLETRIWWVQCESVVGFVNGYEKTGDKKYLDAAEKIWEYTKENLIDKREGSEWYSEVSPSGVPDSSKNIADEWTCPYHSGRMCYEVLTRLSAF